MTFILFLIAAYLIGAIPCGVVLTRLTGAGDVRGSGSGNIGATNVYRTAGRKLGILTLVGDMLKGLLPMLVAVNSAFTPTQIALIAGALFLGHCYPVYLGFKGGKGVATALGIFLVLSPAAVLIALALFVVLVWIWRYISLGSISAAAAFPFLIFAIDKSLPLFFGTLFISVMVIIRHRANIERLLAGKENKFNF
ncbi:MAG: glycerol-3-phosphate acyltransferase [Desulfuromonadales bacterium]|nr:glycerol-3-phosphate acyltransferase [Desulfuromonadales bacterium]NIS42433.1 glycerol-3-phosphate acyltransferase [Desulfuromonadales bacterium]